MSQTLLQPLDHNAELNQHGEKILEEFQKKMENVTEEEMLKTLKEHANNRLWTEEEQACLLFFHAHTKGDFELLQSEYFKHRTLGALKVRYEKILKGHATPSHTPRPSIGNISKTAANAVLNMLTPEVSKETAIANDENVEDLLNELQFDDEDDEEEEEENMAEEPKPTEEKPATEEVETVETETAEEITSDDQDTYVYFLLSIFMLLLAVVVISLVDPEYKDSVIQSIQSQVKEWMEMLENLFQ